MTEIKTFPFNKNHTKEISTYKFGRNWPAVYILENGKEIYIGETTSVTSRIRQHLDNPDRAQLKHVHIISDEEFNKSATLDMESRLIEYISAEGNYRLQNRNDGLRNHDFFDKEKYKAKFEVAWENLKAKSLVKQDLVQLRNTDLFKYSPYKALSDDQIVIVNSLHRKISQRNRKTYLIKGRPGTGKTVLATYLVKFLAEQAETKDLKVGLVIPMTSLRKTIRRVFSKVSGLTPAQVLGPSKVIGQKYDLLIVDESHRLKRRVNIANYGPFDIANRLLGLGNAGTELDWIQKSSTQQVFLYDANQTVRPSDVHPSSFIFDEVEEYSLSSQLRVEGGEEYINFVDNLLSLQEVSYNPKNYDFKIYEDISKMVDDIKLLDSKVGLCRLVAGYAWPWNTRKTNAEYDIDIDGLKLTWNSVMEDWVNSSNAVNEVGCIHTVQGYDLNYAGVIIGPEITYDPESNRLVVNKRKYMDINGKRSITQEGELEKYVVNIYKTLLTRGIKGTYVYISDPHLRSLFKKSII